MGRWAARADLSLEPMSLFVLVASLLGGAVEPAPRPTNACAFAPSRVLRLDPKDGPDIDLAAAIEDDEVRLVVIANLAFLDALTEVERASPEALAGAELEYAHEALRALIEDEAQVLIDGRLVAADSSTFDVDPGDPALVAHFPRFGARAVFKLRLTLRYPCETPPRTVALRWHLFPPDASRAGLPGPTPRLEVLCRVAGGGHTETARFTEREPEFVWHAPVEGWSPLAPVPPLVPTEAPAWPIVWTLAAFGAGLVTWRGPRVLRRFAGPATVALTALVAVRVTSPPAPTLPDTTAALAVFRPLHANIYRAFDYTDEEDVYDALAASVDGALLERLYTEVHKSLVLQEEGGAVSQVEAVRYLDTSVEALGVRPAERRVGFLVDVRWQVEGAVFHWGHSHVRTNEHHARYEVTATDAGWRITDSQMLEQRRVEPTTGEQPSVSGENLVNKPTGSNGDSR